MKLYSQLGAKTKNLEKRKRKENAPGRIRTSDPLIRSQVLYPAELRAQSKHYNIFLVFLKIENTVFLIPFKPCGSLKGIRGGMGEWLKPAVC